MTWDIDGVEVEIQISTENYPIVKKWDEKRKIICLPSQLTKQEAIWTIRNLLNGEQSDYIVDYENSLWEVFDKKWPVKISKTKTYPFIKDGLIHCYAKFKVVSANQKDEVICALLRQFILDEISRWEDYFSVFLPDISMRKLKRSFYSYSKQNNVITFDKTLYRFSYTLISYAVFKAVSSFLRLAEETEEKLLNKFFPQGRQQQKILDYEYAI